MAKYKTAEDWWHATLTGDDPEFPLRFLRGVWSSLPQGPRCRFCNAPYHGVGAPLMKLMGKEPSKLTPTLCRQCYDVAASKIGGAEVEASFLFADVRGSTTLAENMSATEFGKMINHFYATALDILLRHEAWCDRLVGDEVIGIFVPGFAGAQHAKRAIEAAQELLRAVVNVPIGAGVHHGVAFIGAMGAQGKASDVTALGDTVNIAARLASKASAGELLISDVAYSASGIDLGNLESRQLELKGKSESVGVRVWHVEK